MGIVTIFTFITVSQDSSLSACTGRGRISMLFWGGMWKRDWFCTHNNISSGGTDIVNLTIRKAGKILVFLS